MFCWQRTLAAMIGIGGALSCATLAADEPAADYSRAATIFKTYCNGCHNGTDREGNLSLERHADILKGGENGAVIVAGKADESRLIKLLTGKDEPAMPPEGSEKPKAEDVAVLVAWINAGAKGPTGAEPDPTLVTPAIKPRRDVPEAVSALAFSPDGKLLAVARYGAIELVNWPERTLVRRLVSVSGRVNAVSFSADNARLTAAAGEPGLFGEARLWSVADGQLAGAFKGHQDALYAATLSPDGKLLATSSYDQQIKLWDVASGRELRTLAGHNDAVFDLAFRNDGKILASASGDRTAKLWNVASGERLDTFGQPLKELYAVAFAPDGSRVAAGGVDNRIRVWQISPEGKENTNPIVYSRFAHEGAIVKLVYSADGQTLVSAAEDRTVKIWDADKLVERLELERQSDWAGSLALSPDAKTVVVGRLDGTLAFYDAANGNPLPAPDAAKPELARISPGGTQAGGTTRLTFSGKHLAEATEVKTSHEKIQGKIVAATSGNQLEIEVTTASDLPRGRYEIWLANGGLDSGKHALHVDDLAQVAEVEPNDAQANAMPVAIPASVWGQLPAKGDTDRFAFDARAGQSLVFEITAAAIGSRINAVLTLYDAQGRVVADNNDFGGSSDPLLPFVIPADGRYVVQVGDLMQTGGGDHFYRLAIGELKVPTAVFPISVPANQETEVEVTGLNLPAGLKVKVPAAASGEIDVPIDGLAYRVTRPLKVLVGNLPEAIESEPNDSPGQATAIAVPSTVGGRIFAAGGQDNDYYRFESKQGQQWIIETDAARRGSPVDTAIEVLTADGKPIERVLLQAVRDSTVTFRGIDGNTRDCRLTNWEEMQLNQLLYLNGEVVKLFRSPQGPDSGFLFYEGDGGKRLCYFDTSATVHAVEEPAYIVEAHAPGTKLISTGLPVIPIYYANDDCGQRRLGSDSRLTFTAPANGAYLIRVRDARGHGGDRFAYRLSVRPPRPDFNVSVSGDLKTSAGSGKRFNVAVDRIDNFDDEVQVEITGVPAGFRVSSPIVIQPGHRDAKGVIFAELDAKEPTAEDLAKITATAKATIGDREVVKPVNLGAIKLAPKPKLVVRMEPAELVVAPGTSVTATLKVERNGFDGLVTFAVENLPHGVIVDNIGLNGVLLPKGESERQILITADAWVPETTRLCFAIENQAGNQCSAPVTIHVRRPSPLAEAAK